MNQASQMLVSAVEQLAEEEDRKPEDVMQDLMQNPSTMFSTIFSAERMKQFMPDGMQEVRASVTVAANVCQAVVGLCR